MARDGDNRSYVKSSQVNRDFRQALLSLTSRLKTCSNEASMLVQHHPTLLDATCCPHLNTSWMMLA